MSNLRPDGRVEGKDEGERIIGESVIPDEDLIMEQILENINTTPIGRVLKKIASLPEVRREKILDIRRQLTEGKYNLNDRLDVALDRVLDELTT